MNVLFIQGKSLNNSVKILHLLRHLRKQGAPNSCLRAYEFFLATTPPSASAAGSLREVIEETSISLPKPDKKLHRFYVLPRRGTHSSWSSNASDIFNDVLNPDELPEYIERGILYDIAIEPAFLPSLRSQLYDEMTQEILAEEDLQDYFSPTLDAPKDAPLRVEARDLEALRTVNIKQGLALSEPEMEYLRAIYKDLGRKATQAEITVFAQLNSEHCRHKIFNAILKDKDGMEQLPSLFTMIKQTSHKLLHLKDIVSAYTDNSAIFSSRSAACFTPNSPFYKHKKKERHLIFKAETHNHPTFISPYEGAATGVGGEIRDELACGRGGNTKAGFVGFAVADLNLSDMPLPWEQDFGEAAHKANSQQIMLQAPFGGSDYGNKFGRPNLAGFFRTLACARDGIHYGYHKPIMLSGGWGEIDAEQVDKSTEHGHIVLLGPPALRIGLGGGARSSLQAEGDRDLDFSSVQRDNAEMERRCAEVIVACARKGEENPILFAHDLGSGGLGNALAELLKDCDCGGEIDIQKIPVADKTMNDMEILANESQERFLLMIDPERLSAFEKICHREGAPYADIGCANKSNKLLIKTSDPSSPAMDLAVSSLFPKQKINLRLETSKIRKDGPREELPPQGDLKQLASAVLRLPSVACKSFLITIGDRSVGGLTFREQMIGPHQIPVSDYAATLAGYRGYGGEVCALGERMPAAVSCAASASSLALGEVISNLAASGIKEISDIKLCANWMASVNSSGQASELYLAVRRLTEELCLKLGIAIPVGKDSLFMRASLSKNNAKTDVIAPVSLVLSGLAPVQDLRLGRTPELTPRGDLWWVRPQGMEETKLGGSAFAQVTNRWSETPPAPSAEQIECFFNGISAAIHEELLLAYHDISDGGLWVALCEMAFASNRGLKLNLDATLPANIYRVMFGEELGAVIQVAPENETSVKKLMDRNDLSIARLGAPINEDRISLTRKDGIQLEEKMTSLRQDWGELSWQMSRLRDDPDCADAEYKRLSDFKAGGLIESPSPALDLRQKEKRVATLRKVRPRVAILRCHGTNGAPEMAAAFDAAGFEAMDVHMKDLKEPNSRIELEDCKGAVFCGGFSYEDALGAGTGWGLLIRRNLRLRDMFAKFFERADTFTLGVCNGCQVLARLEELIPGANWNCRFLLNKSQRFESRSVIARICDSPSIFLRDMAGSLLPVVSVHAEGRADFHDNKMAERIIKEKRVAMTYADNDGETTMTYPLNPNGSAHAVAALTSADGRATIMMPHPERSFKSLTQTWRHPTHKTPDSMNDCSYWQAMFLNARLWVD